MLLLELTHIDADERMLVVEQERGEGASELRLPHTRRPEEEERTERPIRIGQARSRAAYGVRDGTDRGVLPDHTLVQFVLEPCELGRLRFQ